MEEIIKDEKWLYEDIELQAVAKRTGKPQKNYRTHETIYPDGSIWRKPIWYEPEKRLGTVDERIKKSKRK